MAENGISLLHSIQHVKKPNQFQCALSTPDDFIFKSFSQNISAYPHPVIEAFDGQLITGKYHAEINAEDGIWSSDPSRDILKLVVINRYKKSPVAKAFVRNFGLKSGALASSVAHDSHNIVAVGVSDEHICQAVNAVIKEKGGISIAANNLAMSIALPVAGLMSTDDGYLVAEKYTAIDALAKGLGSSLGSPFMTLSFMALLVIPNLKLSDLGLFDGNSFKIICRP